ncbi:hypothetical protein ACFL2V_19965 [Pseudomonadota bacterium]
MDCEVNYLVDFSKIIVGSIVGAFLAFKLNIGIHKRKEFNSIADPLRYKINKHIDSSETYRKSRVTLDISDIDKLYDHLGYYQSHILKELVSAHP